MHILEIVWKQFSVVHDMQNLFPPLPEFLFPSTSMKFRLWWLVSLPSKREHFYAQLSCTILSFALPPSFFLMNRLYVVPIQLNIYLCTNRRTMYTIRTERRVRLKYNVSSWYIQPNTMNVNSIVIYFSTRRKRFLVATQIRIQCFIS